MINNDCSSFLWAYDLSLKRYMRNYSIQLLFLLLMWLSYVDLTAQEIHLRVLSFSTSVMPNILAAHSPATLPLLSVLTSHHQPSSNYIPNPSIRKDKRSINVVIIIFGATQFKIVVKRNRYISICHPLMVWLLLHLLLLFL